MLLKELINFDSSLEFLSLEVPNEETLGPTAFHDLKTKHFLFVKDIKFCKALEECDDPCCREMGVIFETKFYEALGDEKKVFFEKFLWRAKCQNLMLFMAKISKYFYEKKFSSCLTSAFCSSSVPPSYPSYPSTTFVSPLAVLAPDVCLGDHVTIHSGVTLMGGVKIGDGTIIFPHVTIYPHVQIGKNCRIHSSSVIGADGFGYHFHQGEHLKIWHYGSVDIEDNVEIGASSCVDSGTFSATKIGTGTKIDNQVQVGHNVIVGSHVILCGKVGIAGSTKIGDYTVVGGSSSISNGIVIGKNCQIAGNSGVVHDLADSSIVGGFPSRPIREWMREVAWLKINAQKK